MMPPKFSFDEYGFLTPYQPISSSSASSFKETFVDEFSESITRQPLFERYIQYNALLANLLSPGYRQWVGGSFVSRKLNPNDIDVLTFVDSSIFESIESKLIDLKSQFNSQPAPVHAFVVRVYPVTHPLNRLSVSDQLTMAI